MTEMIERRRVEAKRAAFVWFSYCDVPNWMISASADVDATARGGRGVVRGREAASRPIHHELGDVRPMRSASGVPRGSACFGFILITV